MKKNIIITILAILVLGLGGYLVYDKVIDKGVEEEVKEESKQESKEYDLAESKKIMDKYYLNGLFSKAMFEQGMTEDYKIVLAINNTEPSNINYICSEAFPQGKYEFNEYIIETNYFFGICDDKNSYDKSYDYDSLNRVYKKLFGNGQDMSKKNVSIILRNYAYSEKYNAYITLVSTGGGRGAFDYYDVASATEKDYIIELTINYMVVELGEDEKSIYVEDTNINVPIAVEIYPTDEEIKELYNKALNENGVEKYKFTFKKSDTGYYLESIMKVVY